MRISLVVYLANMRALLLGWLLLHPEKFVPWITRKEKRRRGRSEQLVLVKRTRNDALIVRSEFGGIVSHRL